jgi:Fe(3+) dicitrate transport protein
LKLYNNRTPPNAVITSSNLNGKELKMLLVIFTILDFLGKNNISTTLQYRLTGKYLQMLIIPTPSANGVECLINTMCLTSSEYKFLENYNIRTGINNVFDAAYATRRLWISRPGIYLEKEERFTSLLVQNFN